MCSQTTTDIELRQSSTCRNWVQQPVSIFCLSGFGTFYPENISTELPKGAQKIRKLINETELAWCVEGDTSWGIRLNLWSKQFWWFQRGQGKQIGLDLGLYKMRPCQSHKSLGKHFKSKVNCRQRFSVWTACSPGDVTLLKVKWRPRSDPGPGIKFLTHSLLQT